MSARDTFLVQGIDISSTPKVSLHDHLDGGLRPQTIIELADELGYPLPAQDAGSLAAWIHDSCTSGELSDYLETFQVTTAVMQTVDALTRVAREFVLDLADDGVLYAEVRWAPEQHLTRGLTLQEAVDAVRAGFDAGQDAVQTQGGDIMVRQILCAMRQSDRSLEIAHLAVDNRADGVVGFDLAGPEVGFLPARHKAALDYLATEFFPTTIHAGEEGDLSSINDAIVTGRALRLGHGVRLIEDISITDSGNIELGPTATWVRDRKIALECCPSSNLATAGMRDIGDSLDDHPFDLFYEAGLTVTVSPDNRLMSATSCTRELGLLVETFGYDLGDLEVFALNAADASFLPLEEREELADRITHGFDELSD